MIAIVVTVFGTISYRALRASTLQGAAERLTMVANVFGQPPAQRPAWTRTNAEIARSQPVRDIVRSGGQRVSDSARTLIANLAPDTGQTLAVDVRDADGTILLSINSTLADSLLRHRVFNGDAPPAPNADSGPVLPRLRQRFPDTTASSELYRRGSLVLFERATPIREAGRVIGHIVEIRKVATAPNALRQLSGLIGRDAALVVGNPDGSVWSDLEHPIEHQPPVEGPQRYRRDNRSWISVTTPIAQGPWVLGVEFPEDIVLARVHALRTRFILIGLVVVLLAAVVAERLSRRLTVPLVNLTSAAEAIAGGQRVTTLAPLDRSDEIGRMSRAFAAMSTSVHASRDTLELQIDDRTRALQVALTKLQEAQDELVRQERLAALGHLSGSIAHELRNPLGVMTNALYYLESVLGTDSPPKVREHLAKLRKQVRLSESIITGLLSITRTGEPHVETIDVRSLVDEAIARAGVPENVSLEVAIPGDLPRISSDPVHAAQILMNLLTNALQAMEPAAGTLRIRARESEHMIRIEVGDTGPGIAPEYRERIFEPLYSTKARGIGLGLSVSRSLAAANRGRLFATEEPGGGAQMVLELPAVHTASERVQQASRAEGVGV
jgi:two-component system, NtrC family, sensor histidine kinase HydH